MQKGQAWHRACCELGMLPNTHRFTGKERDETDLYFFGARYYDESVGRFIMPDPEPRVPRQIDSRAPENLNPYTYCLNNPLVLTDPDGEAWCRVEDDTYVQTRQELAKLALATIVLAQRGEKPTLPFYFVPRGKPRLVARGHTHVAQFQFGKRGKTVRGAPYVQLVVSGQPYATDIPIQKAYPQVYGKDKHGNDIIQLMYGGSLIEGRKVKKTLRRILILTGSVGEVNEMLKSEGWEVIEKEGEYVMQKIKEEMPQGG